MTNHSAYIVFLFVPFCDFSWLFFPLCGVPLDYCKRLSCQLGGVTVNILAAFSAEFLQVKDFFSPCSEKIG